MTFPDPRGLKTRELWIILTLLIIIILPWLGHSSSEWGCLAGLKALGATFWGGKEGIHLDGQQEATITLVVH